MRNPINQFSRHFWTPDSVDLVLTPMGIQIRSKRAELQGHLLEDKTSSDQGQRAEGQGISSRQVSSTSCPVCPQGHSCISHFDRNKKFQIWAALQVYNVTVHFCPPHTKEF